jgi:hypothetical protein
LIRLQLLIIGGEKIESAAKMAYKEKVVIGRSSPLVGSQVIANLSVISIAM